MNFLHLTKKNSILKLGTWLVWAIALGVSVFALFHAEFFRVHDFTQGARIAEMFRGFQDGQIPVRWSANFGFGYGMPTFLFYGPFPYMVGALSYWLTRDLVFSLKLIWAIPSVLSFVGMYKLTRKHFGQWGAIIAAVSFTLAPYRAVDLYVRGAVGEVWGIAFFPWLMIAVDEWFENKKVIDWKLSLLVGLLLITHNLMAMFFLPVVLAYGLLKWILEEKRKIKDLILFGVQLMLGIGVSAFFIFPALLEKGATQIEQRILSGYFSYTQHFVYIRQFFNENWKYGGSVWGPEDDLSFFLGYGQLMSLIIVLFVGVFWIFKKLGKKLNWKTHREVLPLLILAFVFLPFSLFLATQKSEFIWQLSSTLQTAQFPWRFLSLSIFCLAILNGVIFRFSVVRPIRIFLFMAVFVVLVYPSIKYFQPERFLDHADALYYTDAHRIRFEMSGVWPDFLPQGFNADITPTDEKYQLPLGANPEDVKVLISRSQELLLQTHFKNPTQLTLNIADFPGWAIFIDGQETDFSRNKDGVIQVEVPAGDLLVSAEFTRTPILLLADIITLLSLGILIGSQLIIPQRFIVKK